MGHFLRELSPHGRTDARARAHTHALTDTYTQFIYIYIHYSNKNVKQSTLFCIIHIILIDEKIKLQKGNFVLLCLLE